MKFASACQGLSLVEVLLIMALLSAMVLPFALIMNQTTQLSRNTYLQSTRSMFLSEASDQMDASRSDYYQQFNDTTMNTGLNESGQTIPYMTVVDSTNSDTFKRTANLYTYKTLSDAVSVPSYNVQLFKNNTVFRMRCGNTSNLMDSSNQEWAGDMAYDSTKKQPGYYTGVTTTTSSNTASPTANIKNASSIDYGLFQYWREGANIDYRFDVPNGDYTVMLYFSEMTSGINGGANRRLSDISLEGSQVNASPYSPYETTGGLYFGNIQFYDVTVNDGVLNLNITKDAASANNSRLSGIIIKKHLIES
jgi:Tfp pilus assembly protein PilV